MHSSKHQPSARFVSGTVAVCLALTGLAGAQRPRSFPQYRHIFLIVMESEPYSQIIGSPYAPILNALARDYGLATNYTGVGDPSEPNYAAMLGGSTFGLSSDDPYWFPGHTVQAQSLMSQLEAAGKDWRGYFQGMPYPGYRGYCYPDKCNGIPDADTQYVSKHNGIVNFADMQKPSEFARLHPFAQLSADLAAGLVKNFSYIVGDECHDMHGAPPWCVDSNNNGTVQQNWLIAQGDSFVGTIVNEITSSSIWQSGNNAIIITFDEGASATSPVATIVVTNSGPRGLQDRTKYNHYSLLASMQQAFGLGCLRNSCRAAPMTKLFAITGATDVPQLPAPYQFPAGSEKISMQGKGAESEIASLTGPGWTLVPSRNLLSQGDNVLAGVAAASASDAWAVGAYDPGSSQVLSTLGQHFDGSRWTAYPLPNVGDEENVLNAVSMPSTGRAWAVGYYVNGKFQQKTLVEHYNGRVWNVVSSPSPGVLQNILYGVVAITDRDVWAVGGQQDATGLWHTLTEHWDGSAWFVVDAVDPGRDGNQLYAVKALATNDVYAVGQQAGSEFPNQALIEHWNGKSWKVIDSPVDPGASALPLGLSVTKDLLTVVGQQETDTEPYTTYVAAGAPDSLSIQTSPNRGTGENDLFAAETAAEGSTWAVGWELNMATGNHSPLALEAVDGVWSLVSTPNLGNNDSGFADIRAIPGGGLWAVGVTTNANGNYNTLIEWHP